MSYPGVDPGDTATMEPVGTQVVSSGEPEKPEQSKEELKAAVEKAMKEAFEVKESWTPYKQVVRFIVECPSGQRALVKHLDVWDLIDYNLVEELDFFTKKLFPGFNAAGNPEEKTEENETFWQSMRDVKKRQRFLDMTGKLIAASSLSPKVIHDGVVVVEDEDGTQKTLFGHEMTLDQQLEHFKKPIKPLTEGQNETYSGTIDFNDRMTFFQELNKPLSMIEPFREESSSVLQDLVREQGSGDTTE